MDILKRIVNLFYALIMIVIIGVSATNGFFAIFESDTLKGLGIISIIFAVINFALFKKFTVWNK